MYVCLGSTDRSQGVQEARPGRGCCGPCCVSPSGPSSLGYTALAVKNLCFSLFTQLVRGRLRHGPGLCEVTAPDPLLQASGGAAWSGHCFTCFLRDPLRPTWEPPSWGGRPALSCGSSVPLPVLQSCAVLQASKPCFRDTALWQRSFCSPYLKLPVSSEPRFSRLYLGLFLLGCRISPAIIHS